MKRWLFVPLVLLAGQSGTLRADYLKIVYNLAATRDASMVGMHGDPSQGGGFGALGSGGLAGGSPGGMPGGGMRGNYPGGGGSPGGGVGFQGSPGSGLIPGTLGGAGQGTGFGGGSRGMGGMGGDRDTGGIGEGGMPGGGMPGSGEGGVGGIDFDEPESTALFVEAVIELDPTMDDKLKGWERGIRANPTHGNFQIKHKWGMTYLFYPADLKMTSKTKTTDVMTSSQLQIMRLRFGTVAQRWVNERKKMEAKDATVETILSVGDWTLAHGLVDEFPKVMERLKQKDAKHPAVVAYEKIAAAMKKDLTGKPDGAAEWRRSFGEELKIKSSPHYTLIYDSNDEKLADRRLQRLEEHYRTFYYWFALKGRALNVPERRLLAALIDNKDAFDHQHKNIFDDTPMTHDGFYVPREQIAVFSARPTTIGYQALEKQAGLEFQAVKRETLLKGGGFSPDGANQYQTGKAQVLALLMQALEDESERTTTTHEGTRQLIRASGMLPRNTNPPEWLDSGLASFFETGRGFYWTGAGAPSWSHLMRYKSWHSLNKLDKPEEALKKTISDRYFRDAESIVIAEQEHKAERKARTMSWALCYFLMRDPNQSEKMMRYLDEIARLPRDMEFDDEVLTDCFIRAFDLQDASKKVDGAKLINLANNWAQYMRNTHLDAPEIMSAQVAEYKKILTNPIAMDPNNPGGHPGGFPGGVGSPGGMGGRGMGSSGR